MKYIPLIVLITLILSCDNKQRDKLLAINEMSKHETNFIIKKDTFNYLANGYIKKAVLYDKNYYCLFADNKNNKNMVVLDKQGEFINSISIPTGIQSMYHYNMFVANDSLYIKRKQFDEENYLFDKSLQVFKEVETKRFEILRNQNYSVYSTCRGEFGGTIFFKDNNSNDLYEGSSTCVIAVNEIDNEYYITNYLGHLIGFTSVLKISNPSNLQKSKWNYKARYGSRYNKGIETLLDSTEFYIPASFVKQSELYHLYSDDDGTYIGKIENNRMKTVYNFDFKFYSSLSQQMIDGSQILTFYVPETEIKGLLIIDKNKFNFKFFKS